MIVTGAQANCQLSAKRVFCQNPPIQYLWDIEHKKSSLYNPLMETCMVKGVKK